MTHAEASDLVRSHLPYLPPGGTVVIIVPQPAGYASDPTHVEFVDRAAIMEIETTHGLESVRVYSFPFPRRRQGVPPQRDDRRLQEAVSPDLRGPEVAGYRQGDVVVAVEVDAVIGVALCVVQLQVPVAVLGTERGHGVDPVAVPVAGDRDVTGNPVEELLVGDPGVEGVPQVDETG